MKASISFIKKMIYGYEPETAIILGSGLGELADEYGEIFMPYSEIPLFPVSGVQGHKGRLVLADISGKKVLMMQGRCHYYEGHSMHDITYPVKVLSKLGIKNIILTNAAGSVNKSYNPGDIMIINDHINFMGANPLVGRNDDDLGTRFPDMSEVYSKSLIKLAVSAGKYLNINLRQGVYIAMSGPSYETPAEINMARIMGADAVGMSTVPEAIVANYCGMNVLGLSCISNYASGVSNKKLSHKEVIEVTNKVQRSFKDLVLYIINNI